MLFIFVFDVTGLNKTNKREVFLLNSLLHLPTSGNDFFLCGVVLIKCKKSTFTSGYFAKTRQNILRLFNGKISQ